MFPLWLVTAVSGVLGLAIGSFLNVVIYRVPREQSLVAPGSQCPRCETPIKSRHNVPVLSWLALRGRCAYCSAPISARYPLVEAGTAALFVAITLHFGASAELPAFLYFAAIAVSLAMIDFDVRRLPDSIVLPSYAVAVLLLLPAGATSADWGSTVRAIVGMAAMLVAYFALALAYPTGVTFGVAKLAGLVGLYLGWLSWGALVLAALGGFAIAGVGGLLAGAARRRRPDAVVGAVAGIAVPVAPCLIAATVLAVFVAAPVAGWYGHLIHP